MIRAVVESGNFKKSTGIPVLSGTVPVNNNVRHLMLRSLLITLLLCTAGFVWGDSRLVIGVVEEQSSYNRKPIVRPLFMREGESWAVLNTKQSYLNSEVPKTLKWSLVFDGRHLGEIITSDSSKAGNNWTFPRDMYLKVLNENAVPKLGNREKRFWKWGGLPENRPIAINTHSYYKDLEKWKRVREASFHQKLKEQVFAKLKPLIGDAYHCNGPPNWDWSKIEVELDDTEVFKVYKNRTNQTILSAGLAVKHRTDCDGPIDSSSMPIWFYLDSKLKVIGYELDLLEAADFDNDGRVEFLFSHSGYNEDGYTLYESGFSQRYDYYWGYH